MSDGVGIRQFKNDISAYVERAEAGEVITVTRRGKPVARLVPAGTSPGMAALMADGRVRWAGGKPSLPRPARLKREGPTAGDYVSEGRR